MTATELAGAAALDWTVAKDEELRNA